MRILVFIATITSILGLSSAYLGFRIITLLEISENRRVWVWLGCLLFVAIEFLGHYLLHGRELSGGRPYWSQWLTYILMGLFASLFFFTVFNDLGWRLAQLFTKHDTIDLQKRSFLFFVAAAGVTSVVGWVQSVWGPKIIEVEIPIEGVSDSTARALDGYRIVQISDLHIGPLLGGDYAEKVVSLANGLRPDLIVLTGDMVDGLVSGLEKDIAPLAKLKCKDGVFFINGNHEYYSGVHEWIAHFKKLGAETLLNSHHVIQRGEGTLVLAGVPDFRATTIVPEHTYDPKQALVGAPEGSYKILLAHQPSAYELAESLGYHLQLSGHTHGGQFFPWSLAVALVYKFSRGLGKFKRMWIYVNSGTGYWGPPNRFAVPSEITLLKLHLPKV